MPAPLAKDPTTGTYLTVDPATNTWRPVNDAEVARIRPTKALDEMGVSGWERFAVKNFMNPGTALMFLRARGYDALPYGDGLNFAVRRAGSADSWKLVDPQKGGVGEFLRDMLDLSVGDVALPAAGAALGALGGAAAGPLGAAAGFAAGGAGAETLRQGIGNAIAGGGSFDPGQIALAGAAGAAVPAIGKFVAAPVGRAVQRGAAALESGLGATGFAGRAGETILSRLSGVKAAEGMSVHDIFAARASAGARPLVTPANVLDAYRGHMGMVAPAAIGGLVSARDAEIKAATVNMRPVLEAWLQPSGERAAGIQGLAEAATSRRFSPQGITDNAAVMDLLNPPTLSQAAALAGPGSTPGVVDAHYQRLLDGWLKSTEQTPAPVAARVRTALQKAVADAQGYAKFGATGSPSVNPAMSTEALADIRKFVGQWTERYHTDLTATGHAHAVAIDGQIHNMAGARDLLERYFAQNDSAENLIRGAFEPGRKDVVAAMHAYDKAFPGTQWRGIITNLAHPAAAAGAPGTAEGLAREAFIGTRFSPKIGRPETFGLAELLARSTATGTPLGTAYTSPAIGGLAGFAAGGPVGGAVGAIAGFTAASPAALVKIAPVAIRGGVAVRGLAGRVAALAPPPLVTGAAAAASAVGLQGIARSQFGKALVRGDVDTGRRRRALLY